MPSGRCFSVLYRPVSASIFHVGLAVFTLLLLVATSVAQQQTETNNAPTPRVQSDGRLTIPAGTHLTLVLMHPVDSKSTHRGDQINAQTTAPVTVGARVVIPPGTFVQGKIEKLKRKGNRAEFLMDSVSLIFPDGYVANARGRITIESGEGTAWRNPSGGVKGGAIAAPLAGVGVGMLVGNTVHTTFTSTVGDQTVTTNTHKGLVIGGMVGGAAGTAVALVLLARSRDFYVEVGAPMEMTLTEPLGLGRIPADQAGTASESSQN